MHIDKIWDNKRHLTPVYKDLLDRMFTNNIRLSALMETVTKDTTVNLAENTAYLSLRELIEQCAPLQEYEEIKKELVG